MIVFGRNPELLIVGGSKGEWFGPVDWDVEWSGNSRSRLSRLPRTLGGWSMLSRSPGGVCGRVVAVTGNPGGPCLKKFLYANKKVYTRKKTRYLQSSVIGGEVAV